MDVTAVSLLAAALASPQEAARTSASSFPELYERVNPSVNDTAAMPQPSSLFAPHAILFETLGIFLNSAALAHLTQAPMQQILP